MIDGGVEILSQLVSDGIFFFFNYNLTYFPRCFRESVCQRMYTKIIYTYTVINSDFDIFVYIVKIFKPVSRRVDFFFCFRFIYTLLVCPPVRVCQISDDPLCTLILIKRLRMCPVSTVVGNLVCFFFST